MKNIYCEMNRADFVRVSSVWDDMDPGVSLDSKEGDKIVQIFLSPEKIRKLRKQLKKALIAIEGTDQEEWQAGDQCFLVNGNGQGADINETPTATGIDLNEKVTLVEKAKYNPKRWAIEYYDRRAVKCNGFASEKDFKRA